MRMVIATVLLLIFSFGLAPGVAVAQASAPEQAATIVMASDSEDVEGATPADRSPLEDLNPAESDWKIWIGPIAIGIFGIVLLFLIRRFSMGGKNGSRGGDSDSDPQSRSSK